MRFMSRKHAHLDHVCLTAGFGVSRTHLHTTRTARHALNIRLALNNRVVTVERLREPWIRQTSRALTDMCLSRVPGVCGFLSCVWAPRPVVHVTRKPNRTLTTRSAPNHREVTAERLCEPSIRRTERYGPGRYPIGDRPSGRSGLVFVRGFWFKGLPCLPFDRPALHQRPGLRGSTVSK